MGCLYVEEEFLFEKNVFNIRYYNWKVEIIPLNYYCTPEELPLLIEVGDTTTILYIKILKDNTVHFEGLGLTGKELKEKLDKIK